MRFINMVVPYPFFRLIYVYFCTNTSKDNIIVPTMEVVQRFSLHKEFITFNVQTFRVIVALFPSQYVCNCQWASSESVLVEMTTTLTADLRPSSRNGRARASLGKSTSPKRGGLLAIDACTRICVTNLNTIIIRRGLWTWYFFFLFESKAFPTQPNEKQVPNKTFPRRFWRSVNGRTRYHERFV